MALAYFDLDLFKPTYDALREILKHSSKGTILVFDELNDEYMPGETIALKKILSLKNLDIQRDPVSSRTSYIIL